MLVSELLNTLKAESGYVTNSMILKSSDSVGATYVWLYKRNDIIGYRREIFVGTSGTDEVVENRTVVTSIEVVPAQ
jgi:hypothetical protein